jgi:hypothetical protein
MESDELFRKRILDDKYEDQGYYRNRYFDDPPPADPPNDHCCWNELQNAWLETDTHLYTRAERGMKERGIEK